MGHPQSHPRRGGALAERVWPELLDGGVARRGSSLCTPRWGLSARPRLCWVPWAAVTWSASEEGASATFLYRTFSEFLDCKEEEVSTLRARLPGVVAVPFLFSKAAKQPCISCCKQTTRDPVCFGHESALWAKLEWNSSFCSPWYRPRWHPPQARPARWGYALGSLGMPLLRRSQWFPRLPYVMAWLVWLLDAGAGPACAPGVNFLWPEVLLSFTARAQSL